MIADRVKELSASTGTGALTLSGAVTGFESFNTAFGVGPSFDYCIESVDGTTGAPNGSWEIGTGHLSGATTLVRDTVRQSSNADALVNFAAGTKNVFCTLPASVIVALQAKLDDAPSDGKTYGRKDAVWSEAAGISALNAKEDKASKGIANGYASLDASTKVPAAQLPSYVDDVLEFANLAAFPATGATGIIYVALDTGKIYRWSGSAYVEISPSPGSTDAVPEGSVNLYYTSARASAAAPVQSVAGRTGSVTLTKSDVGLANVDNTSDASKPVSTATQAALDAKAPLASPALTGNPTAPTPTAGDNDTTIATTAFVTSAVTTATVAPATAAPIMDGTAAVGTATKYAREDHVHASDTSRLAKAGDTMAGTLGITNATASSSTTTGALTVTGGVGIGGVLNTGNIITVNGNQPGLYLAGTEASAKPVAIYENGGILRIDYQSVLALASVNMTTGAWTFPNGSVSVSSTVASSSTTTGALIVAGGIGAGGAIYPGVTSGVALGIGPNAAIRDATNGAGNMYFDVSLGGVTHGTFHFRSTSGAIELLTLTNTGAAFPLGGVLVGAPTGGNKGTGTVNASNVYDDNVLLTCVGVQHLVHGEVNLAQWDALSPTGQHKTAHRFVEMVKTFDPRDPKQYIARMMADEALPGMPTMAEWRHGEASLGEMHNRLWLATELLAAAFVGLHDKYERRLAALERNP
jgi:hypothetical protein